jgi:hypothetical protein
MHASKLNSIGLLAIASLLATGCYCPMLSGRHGEIGYCSQCPLPPLAASTNPSENDSPGCDAVNRLHGGGTSGGAPEWSGGRGLARGAGLMPTQQGPDYVSPQAKFHPVPTRPVFEPQHGYLPVQLVEPADSNPLRPAEGKF